MDLPVLPVSIQKISLGGQRRVGGGIQRVVANGLIARILGETVDYRQHVLHNALAFLSTSPETLFRT